MIYPAVSTSIAKSGRKALRSATVFIASFITKVSMTSELAIQREKTLKHWPRLWKLALIQEMNPDWNDLYETLNW